MSRIEKFRIIVDMDSSALADPDLGKVELGRILSGIAADVADGWIDAPIRDSNGNRVGRYSFYRGKKS